MTDVQDKPTDVNDEAKANDEATEEANAITLDELREASFLAGALVDNSAQTFKDYNETVTKLEAGDNIGALLSEAIAKSDDPEVVKLRATIERAENAIQKARGEAEAKVKPTLEVPTEEQIKDLETKLKALMADVQGYNLVFANALSQSELKDQDITLETFNGALKRRKGKASAATGTGPARPRVIVEYAYQTNEPDAKSDVWKFAASDPKQSSFSALAMQLKKDFSGYAVNAGDFVPAWNTQNQLPEDEKDWQRHNEVETFNWSLTDDKGKTHSVWVRVTKKS